MKIELLRDAIEQLLLITAGIESHERTLSIREKLLTRILLKCDISRPVNRFIYDVDRYICPELAKLIRDRGITALVQCCPDNAYQMYGIDLDEWDRHILGHPNWEDINLSGYRRTMLRCCLETLNRELLVILSNELQEYYPHWWGYIRTIEQQNLHRQTS